VSRTTWTDFRPGQDPCWSMLTTDAAPQKDEQPAPTARPAAPSAPVLPEKQSLVEMVGGRTAMFSLLATATYLVYLFSDLDLYPALVLMIVQMVIELLCQPQMDMTMRIHHFANCYICGLFLVSPSFPMVIRTAFVVEVPTLLRMVQKALGRRAPGWLAFSFFLSFYYTRFFIGWGTLVNYDFLVEHTHLTMYLSDEAAVLALRGGYAAVLVIHACGLWWGGLLWGILVNTLRNDAKLPKLEVYSMLPSVAVACLFGPRAVALSQALLALTSFAYHSSASSARPRPLAALKVADICAIVLAMYCQVRASNGDSWLPLGLHAAAAVLCLLGVRDWQANENGAHVANLLGPLSLFNCLFVAPAAQVAALITPLLLAMCALITLRNRGLNNYVAITMYAFNVWIVYNSCATAQLVANGGGPPIFEVARRWLV